MKVSMDGLRINATRSMTDLYYAIEEALNDDWIDDSVKQNLKDKYDDAARMLTTFNCLYDDRVEDDFNNMSDVDTPYFYKG